MIRSSLQVTCWLLPAHFSRSAKNCWVGASWARSYPYPGKVPISAFCRCQSDGQPSQYYRHQSDR